MQLHSRIVMCCICACAGFVLAAISPFRQKAPRTELKGVFDISAIYAKDVAAGEKVIKGMESHIKDPTMKHLLKDPAMRETFAAAIGSDLHLKAGLVGTNSLASAAIAELGRSKSIRAPKTKTNTKFVKNINSKSEKTPEIAAARAHETKDLPTSSKPPTHPGAGLQIAYDAFAPGVIDGGTAAHKSRPLSVDSKELPPKTSRAVHLDKVKPESSTIHDTAHTSTIPQKGSWLRNEVEQITTAAAQLQARLKAVRTQLSIKPPRIDPHSMCDPASLASVHGITPAHAVPTAQKPALTTFTSVLQEARSLRLASTRHQPAQPRRAQSLVHAAACEGAKLAAPYYHRPPAPAAAAAVAARDQRSWHRPLACALPLLAEALGGIACTEGARPPGGLDRGSRGPSFLRALDSVGLGDDAVGLGSPALRGATLASLSPEQVALLSPPLAETATTRRARRAAEPARGWPPQRRPAFFCVPETAR